MVVQLTTCSNARRLRTWSCSERLPWLAATQWISNRRNANVEKSNAKSCSIDVPIAVRRDG